MKRKRFSLEKAKKIGETLGIDWSSFNVEQFRMGLEVELEHGARDPKTNVTQDDPLFNWKDCLGPSQGNSGLLHASVKYGI